MSTSSYTHLEDTPAVNEHTYGVDKTDLPVTVPVLIVGAGPVGLLLALRLAQSGIRSVVLEKDSALSNAPRAIGYYGPVHKVFQEIGLYDRIVRDGMPCGGYVWRTMPTDEVIQSATGTSSVRKLGTVIGTNNMGRRNANGQYEPGNFTIQLAQSKLSKLMLDAAAETGLSQVLWEHEVLSLEQDDTGVTVTVKHLQATKTFQGQFLVGCDGGKSTVRKLLQIRLNGHSWPERFLATDVMRTAPVVADPPVHFVVDPRYWAVVTPLEPVEPGKPGLWRYSMAVPALPGDDDNNEADEKPLTDEEVLDPAYVRSLVERQIDGACDGDFEVVRQSLYKMHQLVASTMHRGRCFLAGDSAHINNPIGGLGLCTGLLDADALHQTLEIVFALSDLAGQAKSKQVPESINGYRQFSTNASGTRPKVESPINMQVNLESLFSRYSTERRRVFQNIIHPFSTANKMRLHAGNPEDVSKEDWYLQALQRGNYEELKALHSPLYKSWRTDMWKFQSSWLNKGMRLA